MSLLTEKIVTGSISGSAVRFFFNGELIRFMFGLCVSDFFIHFMLCFIFRERLCFVLTTSQWKSVTLVVHINVFRYRTLACKSVVTVEVRRNIIFILHFAECSSN